MTLYAKIIDGTVAAYPYHLYQLKIDFPDTSFPNPPELADLSVFDVWPVVESVQPGFNQASQKIQEGVPALVEGIWTQQWNVVDLTPEETASTDGERIAALWQAAHDTEFNAISGSAVGLIVLGVMQGKPKCMAVQLWIKSLWALYYERKANGSDSTDFSTVGTCPHSVPELMQELGF